MSNQNLNINVTADSSGAVAAFDKAQARIQKYADSTTRTKEVLDNFQAALNESGASTLKQQQAIASAVIQMDKLATTTGKTSAQLAAMKAQNLGISASMQKYVSDIDEASKHTHEFSLGTTAARRELLVLAHEASQGSWKQFGGSLLVLGERTDALSKLMSAGGLTAGIFAAAIFAVGKAAVQGAAEAKELNAAIQLTNNYAGLTRDTFADLASTVAGNTQTGLGHASEVLRGLAATGQYTSSEMESLATVIVRASEISGKSLEDVGKEYEKLAEDPAKWAYEHNQSMHFMDVATYQHIEALQKAGDKHGAIQAIIEATTKQVEQSSTQHLSAAAQAWRNLSSEIDTFWSKLKQGLSTGPSISDQIATLEAEREAISSSPLAAGRIGEINKQIAALGAKQKAELDAANAQKQATATQQAAVDAEKRVDAMRDTIMSNAEKRNKELQQLQKDRASILAGGGKFSDEDYNRMVTDINDKYKDRKPSGSAQRDSINAAMAQQQNAIAQMEADRKDAITKAKADYDTGAINYSEYYAKIKAIDTQSYTDELAAAQKRADIAGQKKEQAAREEALKQVQSITAKLKKVDTDYTAATAVEQTKRTARLEKYRTEQQDALQRTANSYQAQDDTRFLLPDQKTAYTEELRVREAYYKEVFALKEQYDSRKIDQDEYDAKTQIAAQAFEAQENQLQAHLQHEQDIRNSYQDQIHLAITDIASHGKTGAEYMGQAFTTVWGDMSNALDTFVTTGKLSFSSFASSVLADMAKIALHASESQIFNSIATSFFSTGGEVGHYADGGHINGPGSGTSDSIPAMLSNGEFVVNAASTKKYRGLLESINNGHMSHFATGGAVGSIQGGGSGAVTNSTSLALNLQGGSLTPEDLAAIAPQLQAIIDKRINQRWRGQGGLAYQMKYGQV